jgi:hypothetical protein
MPRALLRSVELRSSTLALRWLALGLGLLSARALAFDVTFAGSASVDYRYISGPAPQTNPSPLGIAGLTVEVAQKVVAEVGHGVSFSVKACGGCHGLEVDQAYGEVRFRSFLNARAGRLNVPFGEFTVRHDPTNYSTPSKPLPYAMGDMLLYTREGFNLGVVPAPWVDNGAELFGSVGLGTSTQLDYTVYAVKGFAGDNDLDFARSRTYVDNNRTPTFGARLVLTNDDFSVGVSGAAGTYDAKDTLWFMMGGVDLYWRVGAVTLRAEGVARRTDLDPTAQYAYRVIDTFMLKAGWYGQVDWQVNPSLTLVLRSDGLLRFGLPLPESTFQQTSASPSAGALRQTVAALWRFNDHFAVKADYEWWLFTGITEPMRHVARVAIVAGY